MSGPPSNRPSSPTVSVVIPAASGAAGLPLLLNTLPAVHEVIVVVGTDDGTVLPTGPAVRLVRQTRTGTGNALACGVEASTGDVVVTLAGDGSCDPADLPRYVAALTAGADVAHGSRYRDGGRDLTGGRWPALALLWVINVLFASGRTDPGFGYRAFWRDVAGDLGLPRVQGTEPVRGDGPEIEPLMTVRAAAHGLRVTEVPAAAYPPAAAPRLLPAVRAVLAEYARSRRPAPEQEDIVVFTGVTPDRNPRHPAAGRFTAPTGDPAGWPTARPHPVGAFPGDAFAERRRGGRAMRAVQRPDPAGPLTAAGPLAAAAPAGGTAPAGEDWRLPQQRPNLRVINGEGGGSAGPRAGRLRAVPRPETT